MDTKKLTVVRELHKVRENYPRRRVQMRGIDETWQAHLVEMIPYFQINKDFRYLFTVIRYIFKICLGCPSKKQKWKGYYYRNEIHTYTRTNSKELAHRQG